MASVALAMIALLVLVAPLLLVYRFSLKVNPSSERLDFLAAGDPKLWAVDALVGLPGPIGDFVREWGTTPTDVERIDFACERLADVDLHTSNVFERFVATARAEIAAGGFACAALVSIGIRDLRPELVGGGVASLLLASIMALLCHWMGRRAQRGLMGRRRAWDALLVLLMRPYDTMAMVPSNGVREQTAALRRKVGGRGCGRLKRQSTLRVQDGSI